MRVYLKEKIGKPDLFTGRKKELAFFLKWIEGTKKEISKSTAVLSRRKTGKTAILQRLYNLTFEKNDGVVPFYYEVQEQPVWMAEFCQDFFLTFIYQYAAFKTRNAHYLRPTVQKTFQKALEMVKKEQLDYLIEVIQGVQYFSENEQLDLLWIAVRNAPRGVAEDQDERIVQLIDEFQYLNSYIYRDHALSNVIKDFPGGYMSTAEYKNAPLLIAGSWVGWLRDLLHTLLPSRFIQHDLEDMPEDETVEMIYKYSEVFELPVTEDIAYAMSQVCEGNPFYVSALFHSHFPGKNFTTQHGLLDTLTFETMNDRGGIKAVWMEYIGKIFYKVNQENAKRIVLYLCQHRDRQVGRDELRQKLGLKMPELDLEKKLHALVKSDIIEYGRSNFYYQGVQDNIFDKVFRSRYADDIQAFDAREITNEYKALYEHADKEYRKLLGRFNQTKGLFAEFAIINQLRLHAYTKPDVFTSITQNLPEDFQFVEYEHVWSYKTAQPDKHDIWIDIFARAGKQGYSLIGEVKNRTTKPFSRDEAVEFMKKARALQEREHVEHAVLFVFSRKGFTQDALIVLAEHQIAWSDDERWLGE